MLTIASWAIPTVIVIGAIIIFISKKTDYGSVFIEGAKGGLESAVKLIPTFVLLMSGIKMLTASGALDVLTQAVKPLFEKLSLPSEILPFVLTKPISGSASTVMLSELFQNYGADSFIGRCASLISGSCDTIIYTVSVYFSYVGIKKTRHTLPCSFITQIFCLFLAVFLTRLLF